MMQPPAQGDPAQMIPGSGIYYWAMLDQDQKEEVLKRVQEEAEMLFPIYVQAIKDASGLRPQKASDRQAKYNQRTPDQWGALQQSDPKAYQDQTTEWRAMQRKDVRTPAQPVVIPDSPVPGIPRPASVELP